MILRFQEVIFINNNQLGFNWKSVFLPLLEGGQCAVVPAVSDQQSLNSSLLNSHWLSFAFLNGDIRFLKTHLCKVIKNNNNESRMNNCYHRDVPWTIQNHSFKINNVLHNYMTCKANGKPESKPNSSPNQLHFDLLLWMRNKDNRNLNKTFKWNCLFMLTALLFISWL